MYLSPLLTDRYREPGHASSRTHDLLPAQLPRYTVPVPAQVHPLTLCMPVRVLPAGESGGVPLVVHPLVYRPLVYYPMYTPPVYLGTPPPCT